MLQINDDFIFRVEFFGGVLINKYNFLRYEVTKEETIFLKSLTYSGGDIEYAKFLLETYGYNSNVNYEKFVKCGILQDVKSIKNIVDKKNIEKNIYEECCRIYEMDENRLSSPLEMTIYPTLKCNLNCKFCFIKNKKCSINELKAELWLKIIREAKDMGVLSISILGGEPTKYDYINDLLLGVEKIGINATITTNGVDIEEETRMILADSKNVIPVFSVQALNSKNKDLMGVDYIVILETISDMLKRKKQIRINSVYTNQNYDDFEEIIDFCIVNKIERYSIAAYVDTNRENDGVVAHDFNEIRKLDEHLQEYIKLKYPNVLFECSVEGCMIYSAYPELENEISNLTHFDRLYYGCRAGKSKIEIYADGSVFPCICFENEIVPSSNIKTMSLKEIWDKDECLRLFGTVEAKAKECVECGFGKFCNGGCPAARYSKYREQFIFHKDENCKLHDNILV